MNNQYLINEIIKMIISKKDSKHIELIHRFAKKILYQE